MDLVFSPAPLFGDRLHGVPMAEAELGDKKMAYETILVDSRDPIGIITINRPKVNALNATVISELNQALATFDANPNIGAIVLTGSERVFAAGADIEEMEAKDFMDAYRGDFIRPWQNVSAITKPIIAAVAGHALGGGCELAMMCDIIIAADNAKFGQPEINLGTIPGAGGTQRLTRVIGKSKAMEMVLTGRMMDAEEAERANLVAKVVPVGNLLDEGLKLAETIAEKSQPIVAMAKEAVNLAYETTLNEGIRSERRMFYATFAAEDRKEGMQAFLEKRTPNFNQR